ncbi:hypothetical protein JCM10207_001198, partial [Rhodosporidiobolus poonsookiae]
MLSYPRPLLRSVRPSPTRLAAIRHHSSPSSPSTAPLLSTDSTPLYPGHVRINPFQRLLLTAGSAVASLVDTGRHGKSSPSRLRRSSTVLWTLSRLSSTLEVDDVLLTLTGQKAWQEGRRTDDGVLFLPDKRRETTVPGSPTATGNVPDRQTSLSYDEAPYLPFPYMIAVLSETSAPAPTLVRLLHTMRSTPSGRALLRDRPRITEQSIDVESLGRLEKGTFGRAYYEWLRRNRVTPDTRDP